MNGPANSPTLHVYRLAAGDPGEVYADAEGGLRRLAAAALDHLPAGATVLVVAGRRNAPLVAKLGERSHELTVRLAPPCWASDDPRLELAALAQPCGDSRGGAWRRLTPPLARGYALAEDYWAGRPWRDRLAWHPAGPALGAAHPAAAAAWLAHLIDPVLYDHPDRPGRPSRLYAFLGLRSGRTAAAARGRRALTDLLAESVDWLTEPPGLKRSRRFAAVVARFWRSRLITGRAAEPFDVLKAARGPAYAAKMQHAFTSTGFPHLDV